MNEEKLMDLLHDRLLGCQFIARSLPNDLPKEKLEQIEMDIRTIISILQERGLGITYVLPALFKVGEHEG